MERTHCIHLTTVTPGTGTTPYKIGQHSTSVSQDDGEVCILSVDKAVKAIEVTCLYSGKQIAEGTDETILVSKLQIGQVKLFTVNEAREDT